MLNRLVSLATSVAILTLARFASGDIIHIVPPSSPAQTLTLTPLAGGASLTVQIGFPFPAHSLIASTSDQTVVWLVWPRPDPTHDVPPIGMFPSVMTLDPGQQIGETLGVWDSGGQVNLLQWLPEEDPTGPFFIEPILGFRARAGGEWVNGWVRLRCQFFSNGGPTSWDRGWNPLDIVDFAYETSPGVAIPAGAIPAPGSAVLIGIGAVLAQRQRQRRA